MANITELSDKLEAETVKDDVEEAEINAYMESEEESPSENEIKEYLYNRLREVKEGYKSLKLQKMELEATKNEQGLNQITKLFRNSFVARRFFVTELRRMGETVKDRFIPKSKTS